MTTPNNYRTTPTLGVGVQRTETILDRIVARKIEEITALDLHTLPERISPVRDFSQALRQDHIALIAEVKHASPSKGVLIENFDPVALGTIYAENGAAAISVLTDQDFFQGKIADMEAVRARVPIPVLRKDFTICEAQITEAYAHNADAILLIVAILDDALLHDLYQSAISRGLTALIETHTAAEMERALKLNASVIGINNRDLHTFHVDLAVSTELAKMVPPECTLVAESGIFTTDDVHKVAQAGAHAILVGESIVKSGNIEEQVRRLSHIKRVNP